MRAFLKPASLTALLALITACASNQTGPGSSDRPPERVGGATAPRGLGNVVTDASPLYLRQGFLAASGGVPFVGRIVYFAGSTPDSSLAALSVSLTARSLSFVRETDRYRAGYTIVADLRSSAGTRRVVDATEAVRVTSATETQRNEESVIFQRFFSVAPGTYQVSITIRDLIGGRSSSFEGSVVVPNTHAVGISSPLVVHQADLRTSLQSLPKIVASPRATGVFGRDSVFLTYIETYGNAQHTPVKYSLVTEAGSTLWTDSIQLPGTPEISAGLIRIPVTSVGVGVGKLRLWLSGSRDTVQTPLLIGFGEDLPVASFNDMISYLRFYVSAPRLAALRNASDEQKPTMWTEFLRDSDPNSSTPQHEGLLLYFDRIRRANDLYRGELGPGWLSDRGKVFVTLGEPDQYGAAAGSEVFGRGRSLVWEYRRFSLRLLFQDRTGLNRWELDPASEAQFNAVAERERVG
jgi:GWxTD domain-containing protein